MGWGNYAQMLYVTGLFTVFQAGGELSRGGFCRGRKTAEKKKVFCKTLSVLRGGAYSKIQGEGHK